MAHRRGNKNIVASFRRPGIIMRWEEISGCPVAAVVPEETEPAQETYLHERAEDQTGNDVLSDNKFDEMVTAMD
jgi:hypothetical protein